MIFFQNFETSCLDQLNNTELFYLTLSKYSINSKYMKITEGYSLDRIKMTE